MDEYDGMKLQKNRILARQRERLRIHVYPKGDIKKHTTNGLDCWCGPLHEKDLGIVIHRAANGQALYEDTMFLKVLQ